MMTILTNNNSCCTIAAASLNTCPPSLSFIPHQQHMRRSSLIAYSSRKGLARRLEKRGKDRAAELDEERLRKESDDRASFIEFSSEVEGDIVYSKGPPPAIPGLEQDFWEGPQWNALGFFIQYMWAFGILFGVVACGVAVATYNEGATDFKQTKVYKESIQSRELLEEPEASNADIFEGNPTEVAPSLE